MAKSTFCFVITALVLADLVQGRYQSKLLAMAPPEPLPNGQRDAPKQERDERACR